MKRPMIAVTMGDPAGVGPEICLRLLANRDVQQVCVPIIFGDASILQRCAEQTHQAMPDRVIALKEWSESAARVDAAAVLDPGAMDLTDFRPGVVSAATGLAGYRYIEAAINAAMARQVDGVATAPIHKEALHAAGFKFPGHTEIFAEKTGASRACMMLTSPQLTCSFVTVHVGYHEVPQLLSVDRILDVIELTADAMHRIRGRAAKMVICGLNPHAGEHGLFGNREEERFIIPAVEQARGKGITIEGPLPPDTAFLVSRRKSTDAFVCMYHDQGHIPLKALAFDEAINITLGLPIIRTSVDHGTACDIAWQGIANPNSLFEAVKLAAKLATEPRP